MSGQTIGFVFARGGSKGIPRKNLREVGGVSLVAHAVRAGLESHEIDTVIVSTDDPEIAEEAEEAGAEVPSLRPNHLAQDDTPEWKAWQHAIQDMAPEGGTALGCFVCIPPTAPLRSVEDLDRCCRHQRKTDADITITVRPAARNPYFNMVERTDNGFVERVLTPGGAIHRRQDAPEVYDVTTVAYAAEPDYIANSTGIFDGRVAAVEVPREHSIDIDTELDLEIANFLIQERPGQEGDGE